MPGYWIEELLARLSEKEFDQADYDFESASTAKSDTLCGKLGRNHHMKRISSMITYCIYPGCDGHC